MTTTAELGALSGADDVFVFLQIDSESLINMAGHGRGESWAGNVSVDPDNEPLVSAALAEAGVHRRDGNPARMIGPYWNKHAAAVAVGEYVIVFGGLGVRDVADDELVALAGNIAWDVGEIPAQKRLADELEATKAALAVATLPAYQPELFASKLAVVAAESLSCEFAAVVIPGVQPAIHVNDEALSASASDEELLADVLSVGDKRIDRVILNQDVQSNEIEQPRFGRQIASHCLIPLGHDQEHGFLFVAHANTVPRGFTSLCSHVAGRMGEQATQSLNDANDLRRSMELATASA